jgi:hypothetical protein
VPAAVGVHIGTSHGYNNALVTRGEFHEGVEGVVLQHREYVRVPHQELLHPTKLLLEQCRQRMIAREIVQQRTQFAYADRSLAVEKEGDANHQLGLC